MEHKIKAAMDYLRKLDPKSANKAVAPYESESDKLYDVMIRFYDGELSDNPTGPKLFTRAGLIQFGERVKKECANHPDLGINYSGMENAKDAILKINIANLLDE